MTDETETVGEVARVLDAHRLDIPTWPERRVGYCTCGIQFPNSAEFAAHQAAMLAEAGLLRAFDPDAECGVCGGTRDRAEIWRRKANRTDYALADVMPTLRKIFAPDATDSERQMLDAVDVLIKQAREGTDRPQIATQAPAEQPHAPSGGNGTGGGLGERLRLLARNLGYPGAQTALQGMAAEVDRLERQVEAIRAGNTQCTAKSDPHTVRGSDEFPVWSVKTTCDLTAGHDGEHHFPWFSVETPGYHVEGE